MSAATLPVPAEKAACPECGRMVATYTSGSLNDRHPAPRRFCMHTSSGAIKCEGSYSRVTES